VRPGTVLAGRYEIIALLGRGGMGKVYRARHLTLRKELAVKVLAAGPADFEARFEREARAIARLDHPNCVRVLDYGKSADLHYIAMDLVAGDTLATTLRAGPLPLVRAVHIARGLLSALAHAHAHGVLHRDVKPENVVLSGARPVLIDFGLAALDPRSAEQVVRLTQAAIRAGGLTTLMVTHSMAQAVQLGDRVLVMHRGRVVYDLEDLRLRRVAEDDLLQLFDQLRWADRLDESAAEMLARAYV
jgi:serine/threonine-protein kinase